MGGEDRPLPHAEGHISSTPRRFPPVEMRERVRRAASSRHLAPSVICLTVIVLLSGCMHLREEMRAGPAFKEANDFFHRGDYGSALRKYEEIGAAYPGMRDRALFEIGIIHAHPHNDQRDYRQALESFQRIVEGYPDSAYRRDSEMMIFQITNVLLKDRTIAALQSHIEELQQAIGSRDREISSLRGKAEAIEQEITKKENEIASLQTEIFLLRKGTADKVLIEKKARRMTLLSQGKVIKTYRIALGGDPTGPKERQGDNKTPEGIYTIDSRNRDSRYHLSLHISYPNETDKRRARELGVSPGGDIMIHGLKNGFSWAGAMHAEVDWTRGCIAVTDEEIEEIDKLVPNGTLVEIVP